MSDPIAKAERSKAKDERQMPAPDAKPKHKAKKAKPWRVDYRWKDETHGFYAHGWAKFGCYRTQKEAEKAIRDNARKYGTYKYRVIGPD